MSTKNNKDVDDKQTRIVWRPAEWLNFAVTFLQKYPNRSPFTENFRIRKEEFLEVQKTAISYDRHRAVHNDVLLKATVRLLKELDEHGFEALRSMSPTKGWTPDDYVAVANQLHVLRFDLHLLMSETPSGFTVQDLMDAQSALPPEKRLKIVDLKDFANPLKDAYQRIRAGNSGTTVTITGPDREHVTIQDEKSNALGATKQVRWADEDYCKLAKEIHRLYPAKNYLHATSFKSINAEDVNCAQRQVLDRDRRRTRVSIAQSMEKIRARLAVAFETLGRQIESGSVSHVESPSIANEDKVGSVSIAVGDATPTSRTPMAGGADITSQGIGNDALVDALLLAARPLIDAMFVAARPHFTQLLNEVAQAFVAKVGPQLAPYLAPHVA